jgi:sigma-B regulation protein RsbU (phosphoserine phosphatase)
MSHATTPWKRRLLLALALFYAVLTVGYSAAWMYGATHDAPARFGFDFDGPSTGGGGFLVTRVVEGSAAEAAGLRVGDRILAANGASLLHTGLPYDALRYEGPGAIIILGVSRPGLDDPIEIRGRLEAVEPGPRLSLVGDLAGDLLVGYPLMFTLVGLTVLFQRIEDRHAWLLALLFGGFVATAPYFTREAALADVLRGPGAAYSILLQSLLPALFYAFFATFPSRSPIDRAVPWLKWSLLTIAFALALPVAVACLLAGGPAPVYALAELVSRPASRVVLSLYSFAPFLLGLASLLMGARATDPDTRRKARVMLWGAVAGLTPILLVSVVAGAQGIDPYEDFPFWLWSSAVVALLLWPLSFAYAVVKHRVMEIPLLLKHSARYLLVQRGFLLLVGLAALAATLGIVNIFSEVGQRQGGAAAPLGAGVGVAFGLGLAFTATRLHGRVARSVDRAFFREAYDAQRLLEELAERARTVDSRSQLAALLQQQLERALRPKQLCIYLAGEGRTLACAGDPPRPELGFLDPASVPAKPGPPANDSPFAALDLELLVPVPGRGDAPQGLVALGPRLSEEPYSRADRSLLAAVASQAGLALESVRLAEQIAARREIERRSARELEIARDVQRKLLPQTIPTARGLDYAGDCVQARAVGGDYWDAISLGPDRLAFVLADISGKGISASLLMANLQASLRSRPRDAFDDLPALLRSLNHHLNESTDPNRYATVFLATWDDAKRSLRYACCGHGPPLVLRSDGRVERLEPTGTVIGLFDEWEGEAADLRLAPGDWLVLYSDGVTEAAGASGEEFGELRLVDTIRHQRDRPACEVLADVFETLRTWGEGAEQWDDQTLLLLRALG